MISHDSQFTFDGANFECKQCEESSGIQVSGWKNGIEIECNHCGFSQFFRSEETKPTYEYGADGDSE